MKCLLCQKNNAVKVEPYGWMPCKSCQKKHKDIGKPKTPVEMTSQEIKEGRKIYEDDIVQPFHDGQLSKEYTKLHPERIQTMIKEGNVTPEEVKTAKNVWDGNNYYKKE